MMSLKNKIKDKINHKIKKIVFKAIKPFLPFVIIIIGLFFAICTIIDVVFVQEVQTDSSNMSKVQQELQVKCIEKAEFLNTCHNYKNNELTKYLLDIDDREIDKEVQWSHLYALMAFHNMTDSTEIDEKLLNEVAKSFESTFKYEKMTIKNETTNTNPKGKTKTTTEEKTAYILIESDTIIRSL